jgi:glycosyltransferase involved in cell wall biosynthesis
MHLFWTFFFALIALFWVVHGLRVAIDAARLPWLKDFSPAADAECPRISLLFAARNEEEKLPTALAGLAALDYPALEIIAVDDRSTDGTAAVLSAAATKNPRLRVFHVAALPSGWLGKTHALQVAYEHATSDLLLFTDADVRFRADCLRRAVHMARKLGVDHLTLLTDVEMHGFWENVIVTFFGLGFQLATRPGRVTDPQSPAYLGIGAFQMVSRRAYEASGTHRRLALEVVDDMKLGKIIKQAGFRSGVGVSQDAVLVRWHAGLGNIVRGVTKNFFAGASYRIDVVLLQLLGLLCMNVLPWIGVFALHGWPRLFAAVAVVIALVFHAGVAIAMSTSPLYALTHPLGAVLFSYMLLRSTVVTLRNGGVCWRDTFYPLEELRRGLV